MDHLPPIVEHSFPSPRIPCLCSPYDYDGKGILQFPERVGWKIDPENGPIRIDSSKSSIDSPAALLQLWLYFGTLYDIFKIGGLEFQGEDYVQTTDSELLVTSKPLREHLDKLKASAEGMNAGLCHQRQELVANCLGTVFRFFFQYCPASFRPNRWDISSVLSPDLSTSIIVLAETLTNATKQIWPLPRDSAPVGKISSHITWNPLQDRFRERGWCPSDIKMLYQQVDKTGLYLASLLKRPFSQYLQHEKCSESECLALQISDSDYETKHVENCPKDSSCTTITIDQGHLSRILFSGGIPIFYMSFPSEASTPRLHVIDYNSHPRDFIAISHVWAHGLGNPTENALPSCQVYRLNDLCSSSSPVVGKRPAFWIDTLCIPVAVPSARKLAITRLSSIFRLACRVLVLDADLQRSSKNCSRTELATRVTCCGWMRRLWTLQETVMAEGGAEARKVYIWFLEGELELNSIGGKSVNSFHNTEDAVSKLFSSIPQYMSRDRAFNALMSALRYRTTSKKEDEALCIASILGFGQEQIKAIAGEETAEARMQKMYTLIGEIPASVLFNRFSRKLGQKGFSWAPASLLGSGNYLDFFGGNAARCDDRGLHVQFSGFIITEKIPSGSLQTSPRSRIFLGESDEKATCPKCKIGPELMGELQLIWKASIRFTEMIERTDRPAVIINPRSASESVLVSVTGEDGGVVYAIFLMKVYAELWPQGTEFDESRHKDWKENFMPAQEVEVGQWCVR